MKLKEFNRILDDSAKFNITNRVDEINLDAFVEETNYRRKPVYQRLVLSAMGILLLSMIALFGIVSNNPVTTLSIDINPSIEIDLNTFNNVVDIRGTNTDGIEFIENLEYKGRDISTVIDEIYEVGIESGYFTEAEAYMLIGIYGNDLEADNEINNLLAEITNITILTLTITEQNEIIDNSRENNLSGDSEDYYTTTINQPEYLTTTTIAPEEGLDAGANDDTTSDYSGNVTETVDNWYSVDSISEITNVYDISDTLAYLIVDILEFNIGYTIDNLVNMEIKDLIIIYNQYQ